MSKQMIPLHSQKNDSYVKQTNFGFVNYVEYHKKDLYPYQNSLTPLIS